MTKFLAGITWSPKEIEIAASMWQQLADDTYGDDVPAAVKARVLQSIAVRLSRDYAAVYQRFNGHGASFRAGGTAKNVSAGALAERDARRYAGYRASLTAQVFGDPPPGFSELDKRKSRGASR